MKTLISPGVTLIFQGRTKRKFVQPFRPWPPHVDGSNIFNVAPNVYIQYLEYTLKDGSVFGYAYPLSATNFADASAESARLFVGGGAPVYGGEQYNFVWRRSCYWKGLGFPPPPS